MADLHHLEPTASIEPLEESVTSPSSAPSEQYEVSKKKSVVVDIMEVAEDDLGPKHSSITVPLSLAWINLKYKVLTKPKDKTKSSGEKIEKVILHELTGCAHPGEFLAVMGTSGAGKTSLLNSLAARNSSGTLEGQILVGGEPRSSAFKKQSAYVSQDDVMLPHLTVRETFTYAALLRMPPSASREDKLERVEEVIQELGLSHCADTKVGDYFVRGVSGGERKRASIGVELITNPRILFLDEPTSGLDSYTAHLLIQSVRNLARKGRVVVCTIHQPRNNIYDLFDKLLVLSQGRTVYFGPRSEAVPYYTKQGLPCPMHTNPADFFLDISTVDPRTKESLLETQGRLDFLYDQYKKSSYNEKVEAECSKLSRNVQSDSDTFMSRLKFKPNKNFQPWLMEFAILFRRAFNSFRREKRVTVIQLFQNIFMGLLAGFIFFQVDDNQAGIQNRNGALFFGVLNPCFSSLLAIITIFQLEKEVFRRERAAGAYRVSSYYLSKSIAEIPMQLVFPSLYGILFYFLVGFQTEADRFFVYLILLLLTVFCAQSMGLCISAIAPSLQIGQIIAPMLMILFMLFGGFYLNSNDVTPVFTWIQHISFIYYGFRSQCVNEYKGATFTCETSNFCLRTGEEVLESLGFQDVEIWKDVLILIGIGLAWRTAAYLVLLYGPTRPKSYQLQLSTSQSEKTK
eukprot:Nk52_evm70s485 gene=Nk52_evmTU70s485